MHEARGGAKNRSARSEEDIYALPAHFKKTVSLLISVDLMRENVMENAIEVCDRLLRAIIKRLDCTTYCGGANLPFYSESSSLGAFYPSPHIFLHNMESWTLLQKVV